LHTAHGRARSAVSLELLDGKTARRQCISLAWPVGVILAVLYASLIPFDLSGSAFQLENGLGVASLLLTKPTSEDLWTNLAVYLPVGFALVLCGRRRRALGFGPLPLAVLVGLAVSMIAEVAQTGIVSRVGSWTDVGLNGVGTMIGACLGLIFSGFTRPLDERLRSRFAEQPFATAASALTMALFLYHLAPFDFVTDVGGLHGSFGRARWTLLSTRPLSVDDPPFALLVGQLGAALWFAVLGYLLALAQRESGRHPTVSLASAIKHGVVLVCVIEFMQLFTKSHTFDLASIMLRTLGVGFGAWCAVFVVDALTGTQWRRRGTPAAPTPLFVLAGVVQLVLLLASASDAHGWTFASIDPSRVQWLPFEGLWRQPMHLAACEILAATVTYGALAATMLVLLTRNRVAHAPLLAVLCVMVFAVSHEVLQLATLSRTADLTGPVLAVLAAWVAVRSFDVLQGSRLDDSPPRIEDWTHRVDDWGLEIGDSALKP